MKLNNLLFITICFMIVSCSRDYLSCNPSIDAWAKENIRFYENSNRDTFIQLPYSRQIAIYRGFSSEKKLNFGKKDITKYALMNDYLKVKSSL